MTAELVSREGLGRVTTLACALILAAAAVLKVAEPRGTLELLQDLKFTPAAAGVAFTAAVAVEAALSVALGAVTAGRGPAFWPLCSVVAWGSAVCALSVHATETLGGARDCGCFGALQLMSLSHARFAAAYMTGLAVLALIAHRGGVSRRHPPEPT